MTFLNLFFSYFETLFSANTFENWYLYQPKKPLLFNSALFLVLFTIFYGIYIKIINKKQLRIIYVIAFSLFFYYKCSGWHVSLLLFSSIVDFVLAKKIHLENNNFKRKLYLIISIISNLGLLFYFKYLNFFIENINLLSNSNFQFYNLILPVGISFYTFQTLSYTIDVYRKELKPTSNFLAFFFFVSFFPQLVAGPIVRAKDFIPQIQKQLKLSNKDLNFALFLIIGGLLKKAVISNYISANFVDRVFENPNNYGSFENLMAYYGYAIQIYCDFSGYSDIAIGIALLLGFKLPINFRTPYKSISVTEFWQRWHISLSSWLKDYLYISLGGNRKGKFRTYINLFITMLLGGLWHGASWKFVFWGVLHGMALVIERIFKNIKILPKGKLINLLKLILTFHFISFCWLFFRAENFNTALTIIKNIASIDFNFENIFTIIEAYKNVFLLILIGFIWHFLPKRLENKMLLIFGKLPFLAKAIVLGFVFWLIYATASSETQAFIYFQF